MRHARASPSSRQPAAVAVNSLSSWQSALPPPVRPNGGWDTSAWWAGGSEIAGCLVANVLVVHAMAHCYRGPRRALWAVLAACWLLVGLAFYERALFGGVFAVWFVLAAGARSARPRELLRALRQAWTGCLALLGVAIGYLYVYATHRFVHSQPGYTRTEVLHFLWVCWSHTLIPSL